MSVVPIRQLCSEKEPGVTKEARPNQGQTEMGAPIGVWSLETVAGRPATVRATFNRDLTLAFPQIL